MPITQLPNPPSRQNPASFANEADALLSALPQFVTEANALQTDVNNKQTQAATSASNAATSENNAAISASAAANSAVTAAGAASAPLWVSGTSYSQYQAVMSPTTLLSYRAKVAVPNSTFDPATDTTNWRLLNGVTFVQNVGTNSVNTVSGGHYILTYAGPVQVFLPTSAVQGDEIWITVANSYDTNYVNKGSYTIMGVSENLNIDYSTVTVKLRYVNSTWRIV